jgi:hypothetical protein
MDRTNHSRRYQNGMAAGRTDRRYASGRQNPVHELMELAVLQTGEHLADRSPIGVDEAREILARFYRNAVRRRQRANNKFSFRGTASELEFLASSRDTAVPALGAC